MSICHMRYGIWHMETEQAIEIRKAEKWRAEKWRLKRVRPLFFCPAFFCWPVCVPCFYNCVLISAAAHEVHDLEPVA
jgi:hypothetical protein